MMNVTQTTSVDVSQLLLLIGLFYLVVAFSDQTDIHTTDLGESSFRPNSRFCKDLTQTALHMNAFEAAWAELVIR